MLTEVADLSPCSVCGTITAEHSGPCHFGYHAPDCYVHLSDVEKELYLDWVSTMYQGEDEFNYED